MDKLVSAMGPTLDRYLAGELGSPASRAEPG